MISINSIIALFQREFLIVFRNLSNILSIFLFFLLGITIFVFSIGANTDIYDEIGVSIIWTLILLSNTLATKKFFQNDFDDNSIIIFHMGGLSYEIIALIKIIFIWFFLQIPFLILIPVSFILLNIDIDNLAGMLLGFLIGSVIISCITAISASMNLLNNKNFAIGSLIIMIFSIPVIIFGVSIIDTPDDIAKNQINILLGIMFMFLALSPWACGACIKLSIQNK